MAKDNGVLSTESEKEISTDLRSAVGAPERKYEKKTMLSGRDLRASSIGWEIALPLVAGPFVGFLVDRHYQTGVRFTIILLVLGLVISVASLVRFVYQEFDIMHEELEEVKKKSERSRQ